MNIVLDIGHPAHVHYFRNFIKIMESRGHNFLIVARDKEITQRLLDIYEIEHHNRGKGGKGLISKLAYIPRANWFIYRRAKRFRADLFISFASTYAAHASFMMKKPHIAFDDTEHASLELLLYTPFTEVLVNPKSFGKDFGKKQVRFDSFMEMSYLHPNYFKPDTNIKNDLGLNDVDKFALLRFVSWNASHDFGQSGIPIERRDELISFLENTGYKVFISSETELESKYDRHRLSVGIDRIHDVLWAADLFIGESGTMSTEAALLGTPSVYINSLDAGVFQEEVKLGILYSYRTYPEGWAALQRLSKDVMLKEKHKALATEVINRKEDVTALMLELAQGYERTQ